MEIYCVKEIGTGFIFGFYTTNDKAVDIINQNKLYNYFVDKRIVE